MALIAIACFALAARAEPTVTFSGPAETVDKVLAEIAKSTGKPLKADIDASREVVLVNVHGAPLKPFMDRLAKVTSCRWSDDLTLKPDYAQRSKEEEQAHATRTKEIAQKIRKFIEGATKPPQKVPDGGQAGEEAIEVQDPGTLALAKILALLDPSDLARIGREDRVVWATNNATAMQIQLPGSQAAIAEWVAAHNASIPPADVADSQEIDPNMPKEVQEQMRIMTRPIAERPAKALLVITRSPGMSGMSSLAVLGGDPQIQLTVYDAKGTSLLSTQTGLENGVMQFNGGAVVGESVSVELDSGPKPPPTPVPATGSTPIAFSADSKALMNLKPDDGSRSMSFKIPPELLEKLRHPERFDPLSFMSADSLRAVAEHKKMQLIADVPDSAFGEGMLGPSQITTVEAAEAELEKGDVMKATPEDGFLLVSPADPVDARSERVGRHSLATLIEASRKQPLPSLDDICAYALDNPPLMDSPVALSYTMYMMPGMMGWEAAFTDWNMCRFYGTLGEGQRQILRSGGRLGFLTLSQTQRNYAARILFGSGSNLQDVAEKNKPLDLFGVWTFSPNMSGGPASLEPTEAMPNGVPTAGYLTCAVAIEPVAMLEMGGAKIAMGPAELAMFKMTENQPGMQSALADMPTQGTLARRALLDFVFHVSPAAVARQRLQDPDFSGPATQVSLKALPSDFQKAIDAMVAELKKGPFSFVGAMDGADPSHP